MVTDLPTPGVTPANWGQQLNAAITDRDDVLQVQIDDEVADRIAGDLSTSSTALGFLSAADSAFNLPTDGTTNAHNALQAGLDAAAASGETLVIPAGTYKVNSGLSWKSDKHSIISSGVVNLDFTGMASGYAVTVTQSSSNPDFGGLTMTEMRGIRVRGDKTDGVVTDGFLLANAGGNLHQVTFRDIRVYGFRDQWFYGDNTWLITQERCYSVEANRYGLNCDAGSAAGENYIFIACAISNATNGSGTAVGVYTNPTGHADLTFVACSFDYNDIDYDHQGGTITLIGGHIENDQTANAMVKLHSTIGGGQTSFFAHGVTFAPTNATGTRNIIEVQTGSSKFVSADLTNCNMDFSNAAVTVLANLSSSDVDLQHRGGYLDIHTTESTMGQYTNALRNGNFDLESTFSAAVGFPIYPADYWMRSAAGVTYTFDTAVKRSGTTSMKMVSAAPGVSSSIQQMVAVKPGQRIHFQGYVKIDAYTAGSIQPRLSWYLDDHATRPSWGVSYAPTAYAAVQDWTYFSTVATVPAGITNVLIEVRNNAGTTATAYVDDLCVTLL